MHSVFTLGARGAPRPCAAASAGKAARNIKASLERPTGGYCERATPDDKHVGLVIVGSCSGFGRASELKHC
jgi:hypothetical protein